MANLERSADALFHLDANCAREEWVRIAMAAKSAGLPFDAFHSWSASADNYAGERDCLSVWNSVSSDGGIGAGTLFKTAYSQGWADSGNRLQAVNGRRANSPIAFQRKAPVTQIKRGVGIAAADAWSRCVPATQAHEYIVRKQGIADGVRVYPHDAPPMIIRKQNVAGFLVVPCYGLDGILHTLQFIPGKGDKLNLAGASFGNGFFVVGDITQSLSVYIAEGIGQAWAAWKARGCACVVTFGAGRMQIVARTLRDKFPTIPLVLLPDRGKENQAEAIARAVNGGWCELPADKPSNYDANDFMLEHGADVLADLLECVKMPPMRFNLLSGTELCNSPPMRWMVQGVLPLEGLAALYGPSGSGKSFLTLDVAASIAGGASEWFNRRLVHCPVTYICLEGEHGLGKRIKAWSMHHRKPFPESLRFVTQAFDLLDGHDVEGLANVVRMGTCSGGLVILDTLNRAAPGADENSSVDMGHIIAAAKRLQRLIGGLVLLVHHTGKDATKGLRGHSSLYAALDGAMEVNRTDSRREWSVAKSKDDETGKVYPFRLELVTVGTDDEGSDITSCVAVPDQSSEVVKRVKLPSGGNQKIALDSLAEPLRKSGDYGKDGAPTGHPCIRLDDAISIVAERLLCDPKHRKERAREALTRLVNHGIYGTKGGWLWRI